MIDTLIILKGTMYYIYSVANDQQSKCTLHHHTADVAFLSYTAVCSLSSLASERHPYKLKQTWQGKTKLESVAYSRMGKIQTCVRLNKQCTVVFNCVAEMQFKGCQKTNYRPHPDWFQISTLLLYCFFHSNLDFYITLMFGFLIFFTRSLVLELFFRLYLFL